MSPSRADAAHRPWPPPQQPWVMAQGWYDLLFAHWPVPVAALQPLLPGGLPLDTFAGQAWISVVPFHMRGIRLRGLPPVPFTSAFPELNVRTYVTLNDKPGVWFFSLDAANRIGVETARRFFRLPYQMAEMRVTYTSAPSGAAVHYTSQRTDRRGPPASFAATYRPTSAVYYSTPGTLEDWLVSRYCLYAADQRGHIYRGEIHHAPWPLQAAEAEITTNSMTSALGIPLPDTPPLVQFVRELQIVAWYLRRVL